jgi:hypothetical protein
MKVAAFLVRDGDEWQCLAAGTDLAGMKSQMDKLLAEGGSVDEALIVSNYGTVKRRSVPRKAIPAKRSRAKSDD